MLDLPFVDLPPLHWAGGTVRLPGSKSISNRVLLLAGLCAGSTLVHGLLDSDDTRVMLDALRQLGCRIDPDGGALRITGLAGRIAAPLDDTVPLFLGNAGTAMRPLTAAVALLTARHGGRFELSGIPRMHERPIGDLVDALRQLGCRIDYLGRDGYPPLRIERDSTGAAAPGLVRVRGDVSSQFLSALLLALPLRAQPTVIEVDGELISRPYVEITLNLLARFGIDVLHEDRRRFHVPGTGRYRSPGEIHIEGDASSASYFIALGAIASTVQPLRIEGVGTDSIQGDIRFVDAVREMGAQIDGGAGWLEVRRGLWPLRAVDLDCNHIPDAAMTLAMLALYAQGTTRLRNIASWRVKETDRLAAMAAELRKLGATVAEGSDFIAITPPVHCKPAAIATYDDHRMAMCFALAAFNPLAGTQPGVPVRILDPKCVGKTFPDYFETLFGVVGAAAADIPVITIDGPSASGKGTLASAVARRLGYHFLDSGALYRATALSALRLGAADGEEPALAELAGAMQLRFDGGRSWLGGQDVTDALRDEAVGALASKVSAWPAVREALRGQQLSFRRVPGLVADGRDMGTVIFRDAGLKVFLSASARTRARRRHKQLISQGIEANIVDLLSELEARDARDRSRSVAPLMPAEDAQLLDNSGLDVDASVDTVLGWWQARRPFG